MTDKRLRIGTDDFLKIRTQNGYFVDKSLLIRDVIDGSDVLLLPRPRRFGKTLNLSMLRYFFERTDAEDRRLLFDGLRISEDPEAMTHQGRYPTIFLSLKKIGGKSWAEARITVRMLLGDLFRRYDSLFDSRPPAVRKRFRALADEEADDAVMRASLADLITELHRHYAVPVVVLIDEYDSPAIEAFQKGYLPEMLDFLRAWLGAALKHENGPALFRAVVTGILRIAKESIFSGLNNLDVATTLKVSPFEDKFGFTEAEVEQLLRDYDCMDKMPEVRDWYNGYRFGKTVIYNPWSVLKYVRDLPNPADPQWLNTASNTLVHEEMEKGGEAVLRDLEKLLAGAELRYPIREDTVFADVGRNPENIWSFLFFAGYLRAEYPRPDEMIPTVTTYALRIPNQEVEFAYRQFVTRLFSHRVEWQNGELREFLRALIQGDFTRFETLLQDMTVRLLSYHDTGRFPEAVYHAFVLGLLANLRAVYDIRSEPESGYGRADILMVPKTAHFPLGFVIEFKSIGKGEDLDVAVSTAFEQIEAKAYAARLLEAAVSSDNIRKLAVVVKGKEVRVAVHGA